jgi:sugar phosphate isomerase/epimerase
MKLGCSSWSYHDALRDGRLDLLDWVRLCAQELDVDGVELVDQHLPGAGALGLRELKKLTTDLGLTIASVAVTNDFSSRERQPAEIENVKRWCDVAAYLGAPVVRIFAGSMPRAGNSDDPGRIVGLIRRVFGERLPDRRRAWSDVTWALRQCADYAAERGVVVALQNSRADGIVGSPQQLLQCLHDVGSPWLRVCLDPADIGDGGAIDRALPQTVLARASLRDIRDDGSDASAHWPEIVRMLRLAQYRGFLMIDYQGTESPETAMPRATRYLRGLLHLIARQQVLEAATTADDRGPATAAVLEEASAIAAEASAAAR